MTPSRIAIQTTREAPTARGGQGDLEELRGPSILSSRAMPSWASLPRISERARRKSSESPLASIPRRIRSRPIDPRSIARSLTWFGSARARRFPGSGCSSRYGSRLGGCDRSPRARLKVICDRFPSYPPLEVLKVRWSEATEACELASADVGVSSLPRDLWSQGKCGLKVLQYQAAGLPVLANRWGVHAEMVVPEVNGLLLETAADWFEAIRMLAEDRESARSRGRAARLFVERRYSVSAWAGPFADALLGAGETASSAAELCGAIGPIELSSRT